MMHLVIYCLHHSVSDGALNISRVMNQICMSHSHILFYENTQMKDESSVHDGNACLLMFESGADALAGVFVSY